MQQESLLRKKLLVMLGILGVSYSSIFIRFTDAPAVVVVFFRMAFAAVPLTLLVLARSDLRDELKGMGTGPILGALLSGVFLALHLTFYVQSVHLTTISSATLLVDTEVLFVALVSAFLFREKISPAGRIGILLALIGSVMLSVGDLLLGAVQGMGVVENAGFLGLQEAVTLEAEVGRSGMGPNRILGDVFALIGAVFLAVYTLLGSRLRKSVSTISYTFLAYAGASAVLLCTCLAASIPLTGWSSNDYFFSFLMTVFCTFMGHSIFNWGLKYLPAPFISTCRLGEPVVATILAVLLFSEVPGLHQIIGGVIVLAGLYIYCMRD